MFSFNETRKCLAVSTPIAPACNTVIEYALPIIYTVEAVFLGIIGLKLLSKASLVAANCKTTCCKQQSNYVELNEIEVKSLLDENTDVQPFERLGDRKSNSKLPLVDNVISVFVMAIFAAMAGFLVYEVNTSLNENNCQKASDQVNGWCVYILHSLIYG